MKIKFSMDGINNLDLLYTWTKLEVMGIECQEEHYHGTDYCKAVIDNVVKGMPDITEDSYLEQRERIANETFELKSGDIIYSISFAINTYDGKSARIECSIVTDDSGEYDKNLEMLKILLKDRLLQDWRVCTWLIDEQSESLCREAYQKAYHVENNLRAFASKVLIHFLGVNWIDSYGFEKIAESVKNLKRKFTQRVPEFDNINADFLSMTIETLVKIMFKGVIYEENNIVLERNKHIEIQRRAARKNSAESILDFLKSNLTVRKRIWEDLFVPYIDSSDGFQKIVHSFIEDRNHVAHSKVLSWRAYQIIIDEFQELDNVIAKADEKYEKEEASDEVLATWDAEDDMRREQEELKADEEAYYRDRLASETGMDILDDDGILDWFDEVVHGLYDSIYQHYHLDSGFEISDFLVPSEDGLAFSVQCLAVADGTAIVEVVTDYNVDSDLGETSTCNVTCKNSEGEELFKAEIRFHNGSGFENSDGLMEPDDSTEYDDSEIEEFKDNLIDAINHLNPYPAILGGLEYESKGCDTFVADFPCEQCRKFGVSVNKVFLPIGRCCYCGYENELDTCDRCGQLFNAYELENGFCSNCAAYIDEQ